MPLHTDHRPKTFEEIVGNESIVEALSALLQRENDIPPALLFAGPKGCGKTTFGRLVGTYLNVSSFDFKEINASSQQERGIAKIQDIEERCQMAPMKGKWRIFLLDEAHMLTAPAQNALLKLLEEPPSHVRFILCTTDPDKLIDTIRSRCMAFIVKPLLSIKIKELLNSILRKEFGDDAKNFPESIIKRITALSKGVPRDALILLDEVIDLASEEEKALKVLDETSLTVDEDVVLDLCQALIKQGKEWRWDVIQGYLNKLKNNKAEDIRLAIMGYFTSAMLKKGGATEHIATVASNFVDSFQYSGMLGLTLACYISAGE